MQRLRGQFQAVDVQSDRGASVRMGDQRIRVVDRINDRQRDDADLRALKPPDHVEQLPHAVFQKNRELADAWPTAARQRGEVGAGSFTGTHETNPWSSSGEVTLSASVFEVPVGA